MAQYITKEELEEELKREREERKQKIAELEKRVEMNNRFWRERIIYISIIVGLIAAWIGSLMV